MPPNDLSHSQLIATGFEIIGRALVDLHYAQRTTEAGQEVLVVAGQLKVSLPDASEVAVAAKDGSAGQFWLRNLRPAASAEPIERRRSSALYLRQDSPASHQSVPRTEQQTLLAGLSVLALASIALLLRKNRPER